MTLIIGQNGIGFFNNQYTGQAGQSSVGHQRDSVAVNVVSGNVVLQHQDAVRRAHGLDNAILRTYNSQGQFSDARQHRFDFDRAIVLDDEQQFIGLRHADGFLQTFNELNHPGFVGG